MKIKQERLNNLFTEEISKIIQEELKDKSIGFTTITASKVTNDLSYAKVYFTTLEEDKKRVADTLNKASGFIKSCLCERIEIRKMPEIIFVYDESIDYGEKIDKIIERIHNEG